MSAAVGDSLTPPKIPSRISISYYVEMASPKYSKWTRIFRRVKIFAVSLMWIKPKDNNAIAMHCAKDFISCKLPTLPT